MVEGPYRLDIQRVTIQTSSTTWAKLRSAVGHPYPSLIACLVLLVCSRISSLLIDHTIMRLSDTCAGFLRKCWPKKTAKCLGQRLPRSAQHSTRDPSADQAN